VKIEVLMIANSAATEGSLLNVQGGGWEHCSPPMIPCTIGAYVAGIATLDDEELGQTPALNIATTDADGHDLGFAASMIISGIRPATVAGVPARVPFAIPFTVAVLRPTIVKVAALQGGAELAAVTFLVRDPIPDAPPET
jgi:hypothetical protein